MGGIAQRNTRLNGVDYAPGDPVPDEVVNRTTVRLGLVSIVPDAAVAGIRTGEASTVAAFDPSEHPARDVLAYVEDNPDRIEDVIAAERTGKDRSTLLRDLEKLLDDLGGSDEAPAVEKDPDSKDGDADSGGGTSEVTATEES